MPEFTLVERPDSLGDKLEKHARVGLDTEFMREKTFFAELCLVQVSCDEKISSGVPTDRFRCRGPPIFASRRP